MPLVQMWPDVPLSPWKNLRQGSREVPAVHLMGPHNVILLSWTILTHLMMGSILGPQT